MFRMPASPIKTKGYSKIDSYWQKICDLEDLMNSKAYTCSIESILEEYIPFSNPKLKICKHMDILFTLFLSFARDLKRLKEKHGCAISKSNLSNMSVGSARRRLSKLYSAFLFCLSEMVAWLAFKAAEFLSDDKTDFFSWRELDVCAQNIVRDLSLDSSKIFSARLPCIIVSNIHFLSFLSFTIAARTSPRDRCWKKVKLRFDDARGTSPPVIKIPDDMDNPLRNISAFINEAVIQGKLSKCDVDCTSSLEDKIQVIIKEMDCKDVDTSLLGKLLRDFFDLSTLYDQARSMLHDMDVEAARAELIL
ncbi:hypothetical protein T459_11639 [Capsicum annuum]|uniref:Uncharacterized protein n=1 Tax=Capsicum annuum TaxID=4072 RepID=A0A2G2ZMH7_CAPAN|nr:hypothetical protein T459_11639 [Capsicum annuum]